MSCLSAILQQGRDYHTYHNNTPSVVPDGKRATRFVFASQGFCETSSVYALKVLGCSLASKSQGVFSGLYIETNCKNLAALLIL